jgi:hypothetical protein
LTFTPGSAVNGTLSSITNNACVSGSPNSDSATVTFTPTADRCNPDNGSFTYTVSDGTFSDMETVTIAITCTNDPPVATSVSTSTNEDVGVMVTLSATDVDNCDLTFTTGVPSNGALGSVINNACVPGAPNSDSATVTFTPTADLCTPQGGSFSYTASDGSLSDTEPVTISITCVNDAPIAATVTPSTTEEAGVTVTLSATDVDHCQLTFTAGSAVNGTLGSISDNACVPGSPNSDSATVTFTPTTNVCTPPGASFSYTASDGSLSDTEPVTVTIACVPDPPQAVALYHEVNEDDSVDLTLTGVDPDPGDCELSFTTGPATNGTVGAVTPLPCVPGSTNVDFAQVTFSPSPDVCTPSTGLFDHTVSDGSASSIANVDITIYCINDPPDPQPDVKNTFEDEALSFPAAHLIANDSTGPANESSQALTVTSVTATGSTHGNVGLVGGTVTYTPDPGYLGPASFEYEVCDDGMSGNPPAADPLCATGTVNVTVGLVVTSTGDAGHAGGGDACNDGTGACTLRAAIQQANSHAGDDIIRFNIEPAGTHTISPASALPTISGALTIDGTTQPGFDSCTAVGRMIELDGTAAGAGANGLRITGGGSVVRGLAINRFNGSGLVLETGGGNAVECNYIGTDTDGTIAAGNGASGIHILNSPDNDIGDMATSGANTIANNGLQGVRVEGEPSSGNMIRQNSIHSNADLGINTQDGGNDEILPPAIIEAGSDDFPGATGVTVSCTSGCVVEVFSDDVEEGRIFRGTAVTIGGNWVYGGPIPTGPNITATVTDPTTGNTSEFSAPYACPDADTDDLCDGHECDNDADRVCDVENQCGGDKNDPEKRPERLDNPFAPDLDEDNDGQVDEPLEPGTEPFDCDGDGYTGAREYGTPLCAHNPALSNTVNDDAKSYPVYPGPVAADDALVNDGCPAIGTAETDCSDTDTTGLPLDDDSDGYNNDGCPQVGSLSEADFNIGLTDQDPCGTNGWPSDFVIGGIPNSTNRVTITDLTSFVAPVRRLDTAPGHPDFQMRWDLIPGPGVFNNWIMIDDLTALLAGPSGFPPMLYAARAFNHTSGCPWPQ